MKQNKKEIVWNIVNSLLAGGLVFVGSLTNGGISLQGIGVAIVASIAVALTRFKEYWDGEKKEYSAHLFKFL